MRQSLSAWCATENRFFVGSDCFLVCKTDSMCIKCIFFGPKKHTLQILYWPNYLDLSSVKPLIVHNYSNYQCCQHLELLNREKLDLITSCENLAVKIHAEFPVLEFI